ncbi:hypothetical protein [Vibrio sp. Scap16]|uniref:hypothetical protein n=2 Tax=unclassified Vibrio TaxID=2614977 RepID=UPI00159E83B1|nr:hypothetical protein [Vibrio sp. Scap16]NVN83338.1 hypothetical protein [Vibrio sp. Scap16]
MKLDGIILYLSAEFFGLIAVIPNSEVHLYVVNIEYPGTWIQSDNDNKAFELNNLLSSMETHLNDMAISLTMFEEAANRSSVHRDHQGEWERDRELRQQVESHYKQSLPFENEIYQNYDYHRAEIEKLVREEKLKRGITPSSYERRYVFIHAHSFISSADSFSKFLNVLAEESELSVVSEIVEELNTNLPALRKVRNSAQHSEDRSRGYGKPADVRKKKKMDLKPVDNGMIKSESGVLALSCLNGNRLGYTIDDGSYQEVEISLNTLAYFSELFHNVLNSFRWHGPARLTPHI